jgi:hypothetical protein
MFQKQNRIDTHFNPYYFWSRRYGYKQSQSSALFNVIEAPHGIQESIGNTKRIRMQLNYCDESNTETKIQFL